MPTFTSSREATKDEMAREIDRCHKVIVEIEADRDQWKARAEAAEAELNSMRGTDLYFWRAECFNAQESLIKRRARIAELEAALAARVCVPDREKVARVIWAAFGHGGPPLEARGVPYGTWAMALAAADAAIAAMQETKP